MRLLAAAICLSAAAVEAGTASVQGHHWHPWPTPAPTKGVVHTYTIQTLPPTPGATAIVEDVRTGKERSEPVADSEPTSSPQRTSIADYYREEAILKRHQLGALKEELWYAAQAKKQHFALMEQKKAKALYAKKHLAEEQQKKAKAKADAIERKIKMQNPKWAWNLRAKKHGPDHDSMKKMLLAEFPYMISLSPTPAPTPIDPASQKAKDAAKLRKKLLSTEKLLGDGWKECRCCLVLVALKYRVIVNVTSARQVGSTVTSICVM
jgi:hypothetical protein